MFDLNFHDFNVNLQYLLNANGNVNDAIANLMSIEGAVADLLM